MATTTTTGTGAGTDDGIGMAVKGKTMLMIAAQTRCPRAQSNVVALLRTSRTEINHRDHKGRTALMLAARCGSEFVVQLLIEAGADLELMCDRKQTAWIKANIGGHQSSASYLEAAGARHGRTLSTVNEVLLAEMATAFPMPIVRGCSAERFTNQFRNRMPLCLPGLVAGWPASRWWREDRARLCACLGGASSFVPLLKAQGTSGRVVGADLRVPGDGATLTVSSCLSRALDNAASTSTAPPMMSKLPLTQAVLADLGSVPDALFGAPSVALAGETRLWVSSSGSITPLHFDHCHSVICQVVGRKRVTCFSPSDSSGLYPCQLGKGNVRTSRVDLWTWRFGALNAQRHERHLHPGAASMTPLETVLNPGDAVYIPPGWWHHVQTCTSPCVSMAWWFYERRRADARAADGVTPSVAPEADPRAQRAVDPRHFGMSGRAMEVFLSRWLEESLGKLIAKDAQVLAEQRWLGAEQAQKSGAWGPTNAQRDDERGGTPRKRGA